MQVLIIMFLLIAPIMGYSESVQSLDKVVAIVNDNVITSSELDRQVELMRQQMMAKHLEMPTEAALRKQVLQHLINVDLELQIAKHNAIAIDNKELDDTIVTIAASNKLTLSQLREAVEKSGLNWETYRDNLRKEMLISRVQQHAVSKDITVTSKQVDDYLKTTKQIDNPQRTYRLQNIVIPLPEEPTTEQVTKAKKKAQELLTKIQNGADFGRIAIEESSGEYALEGGDLGDRHLAELPELFASEVMGMKIGDAAGPIRTGNGYQLIKLIAVAGDDGHHQVTKTHVRHILLKQAASMTAEEAKRQANNIYEQLKSGKDFALMAKQYSLDAASAAKGGDLGWVTGDELVPQFATAMNGLPLHTISKPVKSAFGWHLIEVLERKTMDDSQSYQRHQVKMFLQQRKFTDAVQNWQQHLRSEAYIKIMDKASA